MSDLKRSLSLKLLLGGLSGAIAVLGVAGPAQAQFFGSWGYRSFHYRMAPEMDDAAPVYLSPMYGPVTIMSPGDIRMALRDEGYRVVGSLQINGRVYIANVHDQRGQRFRLVVDGMEGTILQRFARTTPPRPPEALARGSMSDEEFFSQPRPPRAAPSRRPPPASAARPERPPARTAARPDGAATAARPAPERVTRVAPDGGRSVVAPTATGPKPEVVKPGAVKPEAAGPALVKPAEAKPADAKPAAPVAEAARPRVVYPDAAQAKPPAASAPAAPAEAAPLKPTPPLSSVPVAPLE